MSNNERIYTGISLNFFNKIFPKMVSIKFHILIQLLSNILHNKQAAAPLSAAAFRAFAVLNRKGAKPLSLILF